MPTGSTAKLGSVAPVPVSEYHGPPEPLDVAGDPSHREAHRGFLVSSFLFKRLRPMGLWLLSADNPESREAGAANRLAINDTDRVSAPPGE